MNQRRRKRIPSEDETERLVQFVSRETAVYRKNKDVVGGLREQAGVCLRLAEARLRLQSSNLSGPEKRTLIKKIETVLRGHAEASKAYVDSSLYMED